MQHLDRLKFTIRRHREVVLTSEVNGHLLGGGLSKMRKSCLILALVITLSLPGSAQAVPSLDSVPASSVDDLINVSSPSASPNPLNTIINNVGGVSDIINLNPDASGSPAAGGSPAAPGGPAGSASGGGLTLKKLLGDANFDFSKLTLADAGRALLTLIDWAIAMAGSVALIYSIWGGIQYITAGGKEEQTTKAKTTLTWAVVGLILIITSYALVKYFATTLGTGVSIQ